MTFLKFMPQMKWPSINRLKANATRVWQQVLYAKIHTFAGRGSIRTSIKLSSLPNIGLKIITLGIIRHLSVLMQLKRNLVDSRIVSGMADCVAQAGNEDLLYQCASSIENMGTPTQQSSSGTNGCSSLLSLFLQVRCYASKKRRKSWLSQWNARETPSWTKRSAPELAAGTQESLGCA